MDKYNDKYNCGYDWDGYDDNYNKCDDYNKYDSYNKCGSYDNCNNYDFGKCKKLENIAKGSVKKSFCYSKEVKEGLENLKCIQEEINKLEERIAHLRNKQNACLCKTISSSGELDKAVCDAFKCLCATIECYKDNGKPGKPEGPGCGCNYC